MRIKAIPYFSYYFFFGGGEGTEEGGEGAAFKFWFPLFQFAGDKPRVQSVTSKGLRTHNPELMILLMCTFMVIYQV